MWRVYNEVMRKLVEQIRADYPQLRIIAGNRFRFRPPRTVYYESPPADATPEIIQVYQLSLLHELGHAVLEHQNYQTDIERLKLERAAWEQARQFCERYGIPYNDDYVEAELDSYRNWLHQRSRCPHCGLTRYQTARGEYRCPGCALS